MSLFRKNYLPKMNIYQTLDSKWIAHNGETDVLSQRVFVKYDDGSYGISALRDWTRFETLDKLMQALYDYACQEHTDAIKNQLTNSNVRAKL